MPTNIQSKWFGGPKADLGDPIDQSLRFRGDSNCLIRTASGAVTGDWTISFWVKMPGQLNTNADGYMFMFGTYGPMTGINMYGNHNSGGALGTIGYIGHVSQHWMFPGRHRDPSAWSHIVLKRQGSTLTGWSNGVQGVNYTSAGGSDYNIASGNLMTIGDSTYTGGIAAPFEGYMADWHFVDGQAKNATDFGRYNEDNVWVPKTYTGTYGSQGFHLTFDSSQDATALTGIGIDSSGNNNHFVSRNTVSGTWNAFNTTAISSANRLNDIDLKDTPTSNYATFNPLWHQTTPLPLRDGNMVLNTAGTITGQATFRFPVGTTGKYWVEAGTASYGATTNSPAILLTSELDAAGLSNTSWSTQANYSGIGGHSGDFYTNFNSTTANAYTETTGQVALGINFDDQEVLMYNGGNLINTDTTVDFTKELALNIQQPDTSFNTYDPYINAGQETHIQSPPAGYKALQTNNLPEPKIKNGKKHMTTLTWVGDGTNGRNITGAEFQPDFVWIKSHATGNQWNVYDSLRGPGKNMQLDNHYSQSIVANSMTAFNSDGIQVGTGASDNTNGYSYVGYCWKAGGAPTTVNTNAAGAAQTAGSVKVDDANGSFAHGTIAVQKMSVNTTAGFSMLEYDPPGSAGTLPHGLGAVPEFAIFKRYENPNGYGWDVYHKEVGNQNKLQMDVASPASTIGSSTAHWNNTTPTDTVITIGAAGPNNTAGGKVLAWLWTPIAGYSKFGDFTGNANADGPFVYLGFKPQFILIKNNSANNNWALIDTARDPYNDSTDTHVLYPDSYSAEGGGYGFDILANGFKCRGSSGEFNGSGHHMVYAAFASNPFGGENTAPATAH